MTYKIVDEVTEESMDGETQLEKRLNAFLTRMFILSRQVPSDECLSEARFLIDIGRNIGFQFYETHKLISFFLQRQFASMIEENRSIYGIYARHIINMLDEGFNHDEDT